MIQIKNLVLKKIRGNKGGNPLDFDLTKEQEMIRKEVRKFSLSEIAPDCRRSG